MEHGPEGAGDYVDADECRQGAKYPVHHKEGTGERVHGANSCPRRRLTVKLRGRATTPDERRGRTMFSCARGAKPLTHHGPLERLLERNGTVWIGEKSDVLPKSHPEARLNRGASAVYKASGALIVVRSREHDTPRPGRLNDHRRGQFSRF